MSETLQEKWFRLCSGLLEGTKKGRITWDQTTKANEFIAQLGVNGVSLSRTGREGNWDFLVKLTDVFGDVVEEFSDEMVPESYPVLGELFILVARSAKGADQVLSAVLDEINGLIFTGYDVGPATTASAGGEKDEFDY